MTGGAAVLPIARAGKLRALAVSSATRLSSEPELPTIVEAGRPGFEASQRYGIVAPAGTPDLIVRRLSTELRPAFLGAARVPAGLSELEIGQFFTLSPEELATIRARRDRLREPWIDAARAAAGGLRDLGDALIGQRARGRGEAVAEALGSYRAALDEVRRQGGYIPPI